MKTALTSSYVRLGAVLAALAPLAATCGSGSFKVMSDERLKRDISQIDDALARFRQL